MEQTDNTKTLQNALEKIAELQADNRRHLQRIAQLESEIKAAQAQELVTQTKDHNCDHIIKKNERLQK